MLKKDAKTNNLNFVCLAIVLPVLISMIDDIKRSWKICAVISCCLLAIAVAYMSVKPYLRDYSSVYEQMVTEQKVLFTLTKLLKYAVVCAMVFFTVELTINLVHDVANNNRIF